MRTKVPDLTRELYIFIMQEKPPAQYHHWDHLTFVHWRVPASELQPLVPESLTVDLFDGVAWIGLVFFTMAARFRWSPWVPGISAFHETNVRTYVRSKDGDSGVWFMSLDASGRLPVILARKWWNLPYHHSRMLMQRTGNQIRYQSQRTKGNHAEAQCLTELLSDSVETAKEGSLEHFLVERYSLYSVSKDGKLRRGRVVHEPYPLQGCKVSRLKEGLLHANGVNVATPPDHVIFSRGVQVKVYSLKMVE